MEDPMNTPARPFYRRMTKILLKIWRPHKSGFVFVAVRSPDGRWIEIPIPINGLKRGIDKFLKKYPASECDLYFCPNVFREPQRQKRYALKTCYGWCDIDEGDPDEFDPLPNILWETSPGRYQGLWVWDMVISPVDAEKFSKALAYGHDADRTGWSITKLLRIPGSINHKSEYDSPRVKLIYEEWGPQKDRPDSIFLYSLADIDLYDVDPNAHDPEDVLGKYGRDLGLYSRNLATASIGNVDRSKAIYQIIASLHAVGASPDEIGAVLWGNAYFVSKHGRDVGRLNAEINRIITKLEGQS